MGFAFVFGGVFLAGLAISASASRRHGWTVVAGLAVALAFAGYAAANWNDNDLSAGEGFVFVGFSAAPWVVGVLAGYVARRVFW